MIRASLAALATLAAAPAAAQEGGPIRTGEHPGFTRVVMIIEPSTEWSLETLPGAARVVFPGSRIAFETDGAFDRIGRSRVTAIRAGVSDEGAQVTIGLGCDCRISASFVGARYLALDVADRDAPGRAVVTPYPEAQTARETAALAAAEDALIAQIARAADQGIVRLTTGGQPETPPRDPEPRPTAAAPEPDVEAALAREEQVEATSVYDRDAASLEEARPVPPPEICIADADLDVAAWSDGSPFAIQSAGLARRLVGEFDRPDPEALRGLARLQVRFGFGLETEALFAAFAVTPEAPLPPDAALLADLARAVEGRPAAPDGPLAVDAPCPGRHGLWLALGGRAPAYADAGTFHTVQTAFAELPPDLRALLGPILAGRLLDARRPAEAALIQATTLRPGIAPTADMDLVDARLAAAEGRTDAALAGLRALTERNAPNATDALIALARLTLDAGIPPPPTLAEDLAGASVALRGDPREPVLRALLIETLGAGGEMAAALEATRAAMRDLPAQAASFAPLLPAALAQADPAATGPAAYAAAAIAARDLFADGPQGDPVRRDVAARLVETGLPNAAIDLLAVPVLRGDAASRRVAARAYLALDDPQAALLILDGLDDPEALSLQAAALSRAGDAAAALALLAQAGAEAEARAYAWPSGDWPRARLAAEAETRAAMAGFMETRAGLARAPVPSDPAAPTPEEAFQAPLPPLDRPSLAAARSLLGTGPLVGGFLGGVLAEE